MEGAQIAPPRTSEELAARIGALRAQLLATTEKHRRASRSAKLSAVRGDFWVRCGQALLAGFILGWMTGAPMLLAASWVFVLAGVAVFVGYVEHSLAADQSYRADKWKAELAAIETELAAQIEKYEAITWV